MGKRIVVLGFVVAVLAGCGRPPSGNEVTIASPITPVLPISQATSTSCSQADSFAGQTITCQIEQAHSSYRPDIDGSPTFCNDAPYPNQSFTLLVWGSDWSDLDGQCLLVTGLVSRYGGMPQIVAGSRSQVAQCQ